MGFFQIPGAQSTDRTKGIGLSLVALVLVAVLPLVVFNCGVAWMVIAQKKEAVAVELAGTASALRVAVDRELLGHFDAMDIISSDASLDTGNLAAFQDKARRAINIRREWLNVVLIDPRSKKILAGGLPLANPAPTTSSPECVSEVVRTRKPMVAGIFAAGKIVKQPILLLMTPVVRGDAVRFVLAVVMKPDRLGGVFVDQRLKKTWTGTILDNNMEIAARSRHQAQYVGKRATASLAARIANKESGLFTSVTLEGTQVYTVFSRSPNTGWTMVIGVPAAEVEGPLNRILLLLTATSIALIALALILSGFVGSMIVRRRKAYERALRESESRFHVLADSAPVFIWIADTEHRCTWVNQVMLDFTGRSLEQLLGNGWAELLHPDDVERCFEATVVAFKAREPFSIIYRMRKADGQYHWIMDKGIPRYEQNEFMGYIGSCTDISERIYAENALLESEKRYRVLFSNANEGIFIMSVGGLLVEVNESFARMHGYNVEEMSGLNIVDLNTTRTRPEVPERTRRILAGEIGVFEVEHRRKDGTFFPLEVSASVISFGEDLYIQCLYRDITERKRAEEAVRESEERLRLLIDAAKDYAIVMLDVEGHVASWNHGAKRLTGWDPDEIVGRHFSQLYAREQVAAGEPERALKIAAVGGRYMDEGWRMTKNGSRFMANATLTAIRDRQGVLRGFSKITRDITASRQAAEALEKAKLAAESANRAKSEFLANMSHEIRTPMNGIMGMSQLLQYTEQTAEQKEYLDDIMSLSRTLLSLIDDILDLSKIEGGMIELEQKDFSLRFSISEVIRVHSSVIQRKGLTIKTDIPADIPDHLVGDQFRLKQVLLNILSNAIKFTARGGIGISVSLSRFHANIAWLKIAVKDTGIGIGAEALAKIFDPFVQADASTTRRYGGTGLGLSICTRLTELMGGKVWAESSEGVGSEFSVLIPFVVKETPANYQDRLADNAVARWEGEPLNLLIVDDQETNLKFSSLLFSRHGHTVVTAGNGQEALEKWEKGSFDLILMDIQMPVMTGIVAAQRIRAREEASGAHTPIIALTAFALKGDQERMLEQGFDGYVSKPIEINSLFSELRRVFQAQPQKLPSSGQMPLFHK